MVYSLFGNYFIINTYYHKPGESCKNGNETGSILVSFTEIPQAEKKDKIPGKLGGKRS